MLESGIMMLGVLITYKLGLGKYAKLNGKIQLISICCLIFIMGVKLGARENFYEEITTLGFQSLIHSIIPIIFSILLVYFLSKKTLEKR